MIAESHESLVEVDSEPVLKVRGLKRHFGDVRAVDGVDLTVFPGQIYGFLGVNGSGKTSTIRTLMGILAAEAGTISLLGEKTERISIKQKQKVGYVSQEQFFYPWMTCAALGKFVRSFYPSWDQQSFDDLLDTFQLPPKRKVSHLSGGMKAKLALALALAPNPAILILDEPTAGMDPVARREFMEIIVSMMKEKGCTTFFSSHLIDEVERCADRIGILHDGKMRFEGRLDQLRENVRQITVPEAVENLTVPEGFEIWKDFTDPGGRNLILHGDRDGWESAAAFQSFRVKKLPLEEIFIACVSSQREVK